MDPYSAAFFYPVGYTNGARYSFLWKPGIDPKGEFERVMQKYKRDERKWTWFGGSRGFPMDYDVWREECAKLLRVPRGNEAIEIVDTLYAIQSAQSVKNGQLPRSVITELHKLA